MPAISGDVTLQPNGDGDLAYTDDDRDGFPAYSTYQYRPGEDDRVIEHRDAGSPIELITPPDLPDLPNLPTSPARCRTCRTCPTSRSSRPAEPAEPARPAGPPRSSDLPGRLPNLPNLPDLPDLPG